MTANDNERMSVRQLRPSDAHAFRAIRLDALRTEENLFTATYKDEVAVPYGEWGKRLEHTQDTRYFGLFDRKEIVGIMRAIPWNEDATGSTALWGTAYVRPTYRDRGLAAPLYHEREKWTSEHPRYTNTVMWIKKGNSRSSGIHLKRGAEYMFSRELSFPGRPAETWELYRQPLKSVAVAKVG
jgi:GNAT superfamily N-acetyltransferase